MKVEFAPPAGLHLPEGTNAGDSVELMAEFKVLPSGKLCLTSIEGADMPGAEKDDYKPSNKFAEAYKGAMNGDQQ